MKHIPGCLLGSLILRLSQCVDLRRYRTVRDSQDVPNKPPGILRPLARFVAASTAHACVIAAEFAITELTMLCFQAFLV